MIKDNEIPLFLAQVFAHSPKGSFSYQQRRQVSDIAQFIGADLFGLYLLEKERHPRATLIAPSKEEMVREYEYYRHQDPLFHYLLQQGGAVEGVELMGEEQWQRNPIGQLLQRWQMQYSMQGAITHQGKVIGTLNFARAQDAGRFSQADTQKVAALCREVSALLEASDASALALPPQVQTIDRFVTSAQPLDLAATLISDAQGQIDQQTQADAATLSLTAEELCGIIYANIQALNTQAHQLVERLVFGDKHAPLSITTLPLPGEPPRFVTLIKHSQTPGKQVISSNDREQLGERTAQALDLLVRGYSNKLIALEMGVSENTVKDHLRRIYRHFAVSNRTELTWRLGRL